MLLHDRKERNLIRQLSQPGTLMPLCRYVCRVSFFTPSDDGDGPEEKGEGLRFTPRLRVFTDIAGYSGVG